MCARVDRNGWDTSSWTTLHMYYLWGLKAISHSPLVIGFCLLAVLVSWSNKGWIVTASLGHLLTKDCVPMLPLAQRHIFTNCSSRVLFFLICLVISILLYCHWHSSRPLPGSAGHEPAQKNDSQFRFGRMAYLGLAVAGVSVLILLTTTHIEQKSMTAVTDLMVVIPGRLHD